jgi:two-component system chemotaxis response regulator CheY
MRVNARSQRPMPSSHLVLVVEDDADFREALVSALEHAGYEVIAAVNGAAALQLLEWRIVPSVVILDLMMPVMDGRTFREHQLADPALASIPVIVLSADAKAAELGTSPGVHAVLQKPVDLEALLGALDALCPE